MKMARTAAVPRLAVCSTNDEDDARGEREAV